MNPGGWQKLFQYKGKKVISRVSTFWSLPSEKFGTHSTTFGMMIVELLTDDTLFQDYYEKQETEKTGQKTQNCQYTK